MEITENLDEELITHKEEQFIFLSFKGRVLKEILQERVFLKVANLHKSNPLIQVNDLLFKGTYDHAIGTNLFFHIQESTSIPSTFPFEKAFPIDLKFLLGETKVLNCEQVKLKPRKVVLPEGSEKIKFNLDWNYDELLKKFEEGTLDIKDMVCTEDNVVENKTDKVEEGKVNLQEIHKSDTSEGEKQQPMQIDETIDDSTKSNTSIITDADMFALENIPEMKNLEKGYKKLLNLANKPMRTKKLEEFESVPCEESCRQILEYRNIECKILEPPHFPIENSSQLEVSEESLCNFIDIDRCKLFDLLPSSENFPNPLTHEEKRKILVLENLDLLSLPARFIVIQAQIEKLESFIQNVSSEILKKVDTYGHTPEETLEIYKKLKMSLERRINEIKKDTKRTE